MKSLPLPHNWSFEEPWEKHNAQFPILPPQVPKELGYGGRTYQIERSKALEGCNRTLTIAPTGCGKSLMLVFDAAKEILASNYKQKQVFIVPQINIGNGFTENKHQQLRIDGKIFNWEISTNGLNSDTKTVEKIKKFLLKKEINCQAQIANNIIGGVTAITTYAAITAAFQSMTFEEKLLAVSNTSFRVDEIHHVCGVSEISDNDLNRMGEFLKFILDNNGFAHIVTATFFRGNNRSILQGKYYDMFKKYRIQFLEHWKTLNIKSIHQNYASYTSPDHLMNQILDSINSEKTEPALIIVPSDKTKIFKVADKAKWVAKIVKELEKIHGKDQVLDLVSPKRQKLDKLKFISEEQDFKAVVTCAIGKEGSDWAACSRIYNTVLDQSVLPSIQKFGRGLRPHDDKTTVIMTNYIEYFDKWDADPEVIRKALSDRFNCVVVASMLDDECYPILFPALPNDDISDESENKDYKPKLITLEDLYGDKRSEVIDMLMRNVLSIPQELCDIEAIDEVIDEVIDTFSEDVLEDVDIDVLKERLRKEVLIRQNPNNRELRIPGMMIEFIREKGWDKVVRQNIANGSPFEGQADSNALNELHALCKKDFESRWQFTYAEICKIGPRKVWNNMAEYPDFHRFIKTNRNLFRMQFPESY